MASGGGAGPTHHADAAALAKQLFAHGATKGGMGGIDHEKIAAITMELSGNNKFTKERMTHHAATVEWTDKAKAKVATLDRTQRSVASHRVRERVEALEVLRRASDAQGRCCAVVDFDMFYAAVELRDRPDLRDKPVAVGGPGMITTANYVARRWGVRSAMPGFIAQQLCRRGPEFGMPAADLVFLPCDFPKYEGVAKIARAIFREYDPKLRCCSLDEAYLDLTHYLRARRDAGGCHAAARRLLARWRQRRRADGKKKKKKRGADAADDDADDGGGIVAESESESEGEGEGEEGSSGPPSPGVETSGVGAPLDLVGNPKAMALADEVLWEIRHRISEATGGLTLSGGLGPNFSLAKVAADVRKPDSQTRVGAGREAVLRFLEDLPCRKVGGVGRVLEQKLLAGLDVTTVGDLREKLPEARAVFTPKCADFLIRVAHGAVDDYDEEEVDDDDDGADADDAPKGLGNERTFRALRGRDALREKLEAICGLVASRLEKKQLKAARVTLKVKDDGFRVSSRTTKVAAAAFVDKAKDLFDIAVRLISATRLRLMSRRRQKKNRPSSSTSSWRSGRT